MLTFKILGMLLAYPTNDLQACAPELKALIADENLLPAKVQKGLMQYLDDVSRRNLMRQQEDYVALFDRSRAHSLYLFEHVHGESRDRGQAMVDLMGLYRENGFVLQARELPDYLPLFLEFLSTQPLSNAQALLGETVHIVAAIGGKLKAKKSGYHHVFRALEALTTVKPDTEFVKRAVEEAATEDTSLEALDKEWEETPAFDGTGDVACSICPQATDAGAKRATNPPSNL